MGPITTGFNLVILAIKAIIKPEPIPSSFLTSQSMPHSTKPTTSEPEAERAQFDEGQIWVKTCHSATRKLLALLLSRKNGKKLHITTAELDLSSSDTPDYGPRFVALFPRDKMR